VSKSKANRSLFSKEALLDTTYRIPGHIAQISSRPREALTKAGRMSREEEKKLNTTAEKLLGLGKTKPQAKVPQKPTGAQVRRNLDKVTKDFLKGG
jgi:hypothetical protein